MFKKFFFLFFIGAITLSACGTFEMSIEDGTPTPLAPAETTPTPTSTTSFPALPTLTSTPVFSPTPGATPTHSISSTPICDLAEFVTDVTIPDGTGFKPLEPFTKTWRLENGGTCIWTSQYTMVFVRGDILGAPKITSLPGTVASGEMVDLSIDMTAPETPGVYNSYWALQNAAGARLPIPGSSDGTFYVNIVVTSQGASFKVSVDSLAVSCQKADYFTVTASITSNGPGQISYRFSLGNGDELPAGTLSFDGASTQTVSRDIPFSVIDPAHPELSWVQVLVSGPNQQTVSDQDPLKCP